MARPDDRPLVQFCTDLDPHVSGALRKELTALRELMALFPNASLKDTLKTVEGLLRESRSSVPALAQRAEDVLRRPEASTVAAWLADAKALPVAQLKQLGRALKLDGLAGAKTAQLAALKAWLESGGRTRPESPALKAERHARRLADEIRPLFAHLDATAAARILAATDRAYADKALGKAGFEAFAKALGVPVSGTKPQMKKQFREFVNRRAVSHRQTDF